MSTNKKFRIQNGVDVSNGDISINDVTVIGADGKVVPAAIADAVAGLTSSDIADLQAQVSAILGTSPETLDTLQEIVAAFENADSTLTGSVAQNASDIATINTTLTNGVATPTDVADLQSQVTSNDTDIAANAAAIAAANARTSGISTSSGSSNIEMTADVDMGGNAINNLADPSSAQDAATKAYVDAEASTRSDLGSQLLGYININSAAITAEENARIAGDVANSNEVNVETARAVAVEGSLQSQIDSVSSTGVSGRQALQDAIDAEEAARIAADAVLQANIDSEAASRASADTTLQSNIDTVSSAVSAITNGSPETLNQLTELVAAYEGADASLQTLIDNLGGDASALTARVSTLESEMDDTESLTATNTSAISAEATARATADTSLSNDIAAEASARAAAVSAETSARQNAITAETNARILADNGLQSQIDALDNSTTGDKSNLQAQITSNDSDISSLQTALATETSAREAADLLMQDDIDGEATNRQAADAALQSDIDDEIAARIAAVDAEAQQRNAADSSLQTQINSIVSNTDPAALDSLTEIVAAFQSADGSITGVVNSNTSRIANLETNQAIVLAWNTDNVSEGSTNLYFTDARGKACVGADNGSCLDYNQASGKFSLDLTETAGALVPDNSTNADKLDGQHGSHYRIDVYDVNGTVVN
jgi:hypothetical protein